MNLSPLTIKPAPEPRQADIDTFTLWLMSEDVKPVDPSKIRCTTETLDQLRSGIDLQSFGTSGCRMVHFKHNWLLVHDFGDYRLTYDARVGRP